MNHNATSVQQDPEDDTRYQDMQQEEDHGAVASVKRAYQALVSSPVIGYGASYELLHYTFDLQLWTMLGAKRNLKVGDVIPLRLLLKGESFNALYWRSAHLALVDLVRQRGYPKVFWTMAPLEASFPYHTAVRDELAKVRRRRMKLPVLETLHMTHVMNQTVVGFLTGSNQQTQGRADRSWQTHLFAAGGDTVSFHRFEFQDGSRKLPTQDYHGSGRPHVHALFFADDMKDMALERWVRTTLPDDQPLRGYVLSGQSDWSGTTPWPQDAGPDRWDHETGTYKFKYTADDAADGRRGYIVPVMDALKCHQDLQLARAGDDGALRAYVTKYVAKMSDGFYEELLNDDADADSIAATVLQRYRPHEPEMVLHLFGGTFRQWRLGTHSRGKRDFVVPWPDKVPMPNAVHHYEACTWKSANMSLLDFLRKTGEEGTIHHWLKKRWEADGGQLTMEEFAVDYTMRGEKVVAAEMLSRMNDKFFGQWLMLHVPFHRAADFLDEAVMELVPADMKYLALAWLCPHPHAQALLRDEEALRAVHSLASG